MSKKMIYASPKGENIVFDNWTENEEFEGLWVDLCPECLSKYQDILKGKLDDAGSGTAACSVYGCSNFNVPVITQTNTSRAFCAVCASSEFILIFAISIYQSQNTSHRKS